MVSTHQAGRETEYESSYHRQVDMWPKSWLLNLYPMTRASCKRYLGAANNLDAPIEVKQHFAEQASSLK